jgi:hypothetical protein
MHLAEMGKYLLGFDPYTTRTDWILRWHKDIMVNIVKFLEPQVTLKNE